MPFDNEILELTTSIFETMLHLPVQSEAGSFPKGERTMSACVCISGAWRGAVALSCGENLASEAAGVMFGLAEADAKLSDMQDAMGELANMIGGNIKALLPETCQLSLPSVVQGSDFTMRVPGSRLVTRVPLRSGSHFLSVSLLQSEADAA